MTIQQYIDIDKAYTILNEKLFDNELPPVLLTLRGNRKAYGYYWNDIMENREDDTKISEIALNINTFKERTNEDILSTLLHEMVHHWQYVFGKPSRNGYHNKEWGTEMKRVGLYPSNTGKEGGKETGQQMTHYIIKGGVFEKLLEELKDIKIQFNCVVSTPTKKAANNKVKYVCPECDTKVWGKDGLNILCNDCDIKMEVN
mgnify:FL=1